MQPLLKRIPWMGMVQAGVLVCFVASPVSAAPDNKLTNEQDKMSYSIGANVGKNLKRQAINVRSESFMKGLNEGLTGKLTLMTEQDVENSLMALQQKIVTAENQKRLADAEENKHKSQAFLDENKKKPGVVVLTSGLQYEVLKSGPASATPPHETDSVVTHYKGTLIDGTEFDSSYSGQPATFPVNALIPGWTEALLLMRPGDKWKLYIPSNLAYGEQGMGAKIGPNQALVFELELLSIKKPENKKVG